MQITCEPVYDQAVIQRIAGRYRTEIDALENVGFLKLYLVRELLEPYSVFRYPFILAAALAFREPIYIEKPYRLATYTPLLVCLETACIAMLMGKGVKYYTHFTDGTVLVSNNFETQQFRLPDVGYYKYGDRVPFETAHRLHQDRVREMIRSGKDLDHHLEYDDYVAMSQKEMIVYNAASQSPHEINP